MSSLVRRFLPTLRSRLLFLVLLSVLPALGLAYLTNVEQRREAMARARSDALQLTHLASAHQKRVAESMHHMLLVLARYPAIRSGEARAVSHLFAGILKDDPMCVDLGLARPDGRIVAGARPPGDRANLGRRAWFRRVLNDRQFVAGTYQVDAGGTRPILHFGFPVEDDARALKFVLYTAIDLHWLSNLASESSFPAGASLTVIDASGTILASHPERKQWVGKSLAGTPIMQTLMAQREGTAEMKDPDGIPTVYAFTPLFESPESRGFMIIGINRKLITAEADRAFAAAFVAMILASLLALIAAWFGGDFFVIRQVRALVDASQRLRRGDLEARSGLVYGHGELDDLARSFDEMALALQKRHTDMEDARLALKESQELFRSFMDNSPAVAFLKDQKGRYIYTNAPFVRLVGFDAQASNDKTDHHWLPDNVARRLRDNDTQAFQSNRVTETIEALPIPGRGERSWLLFRFPVLVSREKRLIGGVAIDITERMALEEQLRQAQKMEAVGRLAGGVAHDFNNLLTVIQGFSDLILRREDPKSVTGIQVEQIRKASARAAAMTRQLLAFSRQEVVQPKILNLNNIILDMDKMLGRLIDEDVDIATIPAEDLGNVKADPGQIEQILLNLVVNARDAMPRGGKLTIETSNVTLDALCTRSRNGLKPGNYVMLAVTDSGTGMDAATKARIFEPFFTTKGVGKGTGLGLATVYGIARQCEGDVQVYSEPGHGATFKIYLPRVEDSLTPVLQILKLEIPRGSETILIVEDERLVRASMRTSLEIGGYTLLEAGSGPEAIALMDEYKGNIDLLITDMVMPQMSGPELVKRITKTRPDLKVLYVSGYAEKAVIRQGLMDPRSVFLQKPFGLDALSRTVREVLDSPGARAA